MKKLAGFTLAELLVALFILGVIAAFSIPKVLVSQQESKYRAMAKEAMAAISGAYDAYRLEHAPDGETKAEDLKPYLNYLSEVTGDIDSTPGDTVWECGNFGPCIKLHSGAVLGFADYKFGGVTNGHYILFVFDADGVAGNTLTGPSKSLEIMLHFNGRVKTTAERNASTDITYEAWSGSPVTYGPDVIVDWFYW